MNRPVFEVGEKLRYIGDDWYDYGTVVYLIQDDGDDEMPYLVNPDPECRDERHRLSLYIELGDLEEAESNA